MALFSNKNNYLGIDIGSSSIKVVELANVNGRARLVTYGFTEKRMDSWSGKSDLANPENLYPILSEVCKKANITSNKVIGALPNFSVFTSILNLPAMTKKELESAITWEAKKIIPIPLENIILDWKIVDEKEDGSSAMGQNDGQQIRSLKKIFSRPQKNLKILLTGASKTLVKKYIEIFNKAGLNLLSLETESFALVRSLIGNDKSIIMIVDLGASTSGVTVVERGVPILNRSIEVGGMMITRAISTSLNVNLDRAEQFKQDMALDDSLANNSLPQTVERAFASILNEIKYTINLYQEQNSKKIEKIILTGGSSLLGNLSGYLSRVLNVNVYVGDPWARVIFPTELKPILDRLGPRFSVAIGLAMRNIE